MATNSVINIMWVDGYYGTLPADGMGKRYRSALGACEDPNGAERNRHGEDEATGYAHPDSAPRGKNETTMRWRPRSSVLILYCGLLLVNCDNVSEHSIGARPQGMPWDKVEYYNTCSRR